MMLFRLGYAFRNRLRDAGSTTIAPEPLVRGQVWGQNSALCVYSVTGVTSHPAGFTVKKLKAQCDHFRGPSGRHGETRASIRRHLHLVFRSTPDAGIRYPLFP
jgi:hypothetical protein